MYKVIAYICIVAVTFFVVWFTPSISQLTLMENIAYWVMYFFYIVGVTFLFFAITERLEDKAFMKKNNQMIKHKGRRYKSMDELEDYLGWGKNRGE